MNRHDPNLGPAWVYRIFDADARLLYIGATTNLPMRIEAHGDKWWGPQIAKVKAKVYRTVGEARQVEKDAIRAERPRFNIMHRDASPFGRRSWTAEEYDDYIEARSRSGIAGGSPFVFSGPRGLITRLRAERVTRYGEPA